MAEAEIRKRVIEGNVPVCFTIEGHDDVLCYNISRNTNLGLFAYEKLSSFITTDGEQCPDLWFEINSKPARWQLPVGVIYDAVFFNEETIKPLIVAIHTSNFPVGNIIRCDKKNTAYSVFCHSFKESLFTTAGSTEFIQRNPNSHREIALSLTKHETSNVSNIMSMRLSQSSSWKAYPIRIINHEAIEIPLLYISQASKNETVADAIKARGLPESKVISNGITLEPSSLLSQVVPLLMCPDGFFYIVV